MDAKFITSIHEKSISKKLLTLNQDEKQVKSLFESVDLQKIFWQFLGENCRQPVFQSLFLRTSSLDYKLWLACKIKTSLKSAHLHRREQIPEVRDKRRHKKKFSFKPKFGFEF